MRTFDPMNPKTIDPYSAENFSEAIEPLTFIDEMPADRKEIAERLLKALEQYHDKGIGAEIVAENLDALVYGYWKPYIDDEQQQIDSFYGVYHDD